MGTDIYDAGGLRQLQRASKSAKHLESDARAAITKRPNQDNSPTGLLKAAHHLPANATLGHLPVRRAPVDFL
jgi:hypothetical protein